LTIIRPNAGLSKFRFQQGKTHRLRLINAGAEGIQRFSIDGHDMTVIANDFVPLQPYTTQVVTLGVSFLDLFNIKISADKPNR
jgi:FtsP/CotA-like multicopper oxidase with cupredoxin domain